MDRALAAVGHPGTYRNVRALLARFLAFSAWTATLRPRCPFSDRGVTGAPVCLCRWWSRSLFREAPTRGRGAAGLERWSVGGKNPGGSDEPTRLTYGRGAVGNREAYNSTGAEGSHSKKLIAFHTNRAGFPEVFL